MKNKLWLVLILSVIVYGWNFWGTSVYMLDEAKNAGCAAEMMRTGNLIVPFFNGEFHDKPALQYYFMIAAYKAFGVNSFSARLFSVVAGIASVLMLFVFVRRAINKDVAFYSSLLMIGSIQMAIQFRLAVPDPFLIFFLETGLLAFYTGYAEGKSVFLYLFYACIGLAFLSKGPIAFVLPGITILLYLILRRDLSVNRLASLRIFSGIAITLVVALPWYILVGLETNWQWIEYFFITHNFDRYINTFEGHRGFPFDVVVIVFAALLPASAFFPQALRVSWRDRNLHPLLIFSLSVCLSFCGFFFFSKTVLPSYPAPCVPFAAVILGYFIFVAQNQIGTYLRSLTVSAVVVFVIASSLPFVAFAAITHDPVLAEFSSFSLLFIIAPIGALVGFYFIRKGQLPKAVYAYVASFIILFLMASTVALPRIDSRNPVSMSIHFLRDSKLPVAYFERINSGYIFQYGEAIPKLSDRDDVIAFVKKHGTIIIVSTRKEWDRAEIPGFRTLYEGKDLFENPVSVVLTNDARSPDCQ